jgi:predicted GTPase
MKKQFIIFLIFAIQFGGCISPKKVYNDTPIDKENGTIKKILKSANSETDDKSVIVFTSWFEKDTIRIMSGKKIVFERVVKTSPETGLSTFTGISNDESVKIQILSPKTFEIKLKKSDLKKYKFVYIKRNAMKRDDFSLEYSNEWKKFM